MLKTKSKEVAPQPIRTSPRGKGKNVVVSTKESMVSNPNLSLLYIWRQINSPVNKVNFEMQKLSKGLNAHLEELSVSIGPAIEKEGVIATTRTRRAVQERKALCPPYTTEFGSVEKKDKKAKGTRLRKVEKP